MGIFFRSSLQCEPYYRQQIFCWFSLPRADSSLTTKAGRTRVFRKTVTNAGIYIVSNEALCSPVILSVKRSSDSEKRLSNMDATMFYTWHFHHAGWIFKSVEEELFLCLLKSRSTTASGNINHSRYDLTLAPNNESHCFISLWLMKIQQVVLNSKYSNLNSQPELDRGGISPPPPEYFCLARVKLPQSSKTHFTASASLWIRFIIDTQSWHGC